ncbi:hypothetical protein ACI3KW_00075 [Devosia sp. ZW T5_3]|uniref:hypothetical protein n=1 Tax=Devosia sp. ZW T5_3 TaxID=3378085 RepID=UPI0038520439
MFANGYQKAYHFHLKKCGGTSLNAWLDWHVANDQRWVEPVVDPRTPERQHLDDLVNSAAFYVSPIVGTHRTLWKGLPPSTFRFTIIRKPRDRLLSQIADWRREANAGHVTGNIEEVAIDKASKMSLRDFLEEFKATDAVGFIDNHQVRALASPTTAGVFSSRDAGALLQNAIDNVVAEYFLVGIAERMVETRAVIASRLGVVPDDVAGGMRNVTGRSNISAEEIDDASDILDELTRYDDELYAFCSRRFDDLYRDEASYSEATFEALHAEQAVSRLRPYLSDSSIIMDVNDVLIGSGFHGRDSAETGKCRVWSGPAARTVLYMPCPPAVDLSVKLWIHGYSKERQRAQMRFYVDDEPAPHVFESKDGWRDIAIIPACTKRPFLKLSFELDETVGAHPDAPNGDFRNRGVSFDRYGWTLPNGSTTAGLVSADTGHVGQISTGASFFTNLATKLVSLTDDQRLELDKHLNYLAAKAFTSVEAILQGSAFDAAPEVISDAQKNITAVLTSVPPPASAISSNRVMQITEEAERRLKG